MKIHRLVARGVLALVLLAAGAAAAQAQATRTWVSGVGDDANPCSRTAPCKTFAGTISKTAAGGEINVLDPGGFGSLTINKSITITSEKFEAGVLVSGTNAIIVNAGINDSVILRGLDIEGLGTGLAGVKFLAGGSLLIEDSQIHAFRGTNGRGVDVALATAGKVVLHNVRISDCGEGIRVNSTGGVVNAILDDVLINTSTTFGLAAATNAVVTVRDSDLSNNGSAAVRTLHASTLVNLYGSTVAGNNVGVFADTAGSRIRIGDNQILNNGTGIKITAGAFVETGGFNHVIGNAASQPANASYVTQ